MRLRHIKLSSQIQVWKKYDFTFWNLILNSKPPFCWVGLKKKKGKLTSVLMGIASAAVTDSCYMILKSKVMLCWGCFQGYLLQPTRPLQVQTIPATLWHVGLFISINLDSWGRHFSLDHVMFLVSSPDYKHGPHPLPSPSPSLLLISPPPW